ncbi:hypothetical protein PGH47_34820 [Streptomyces sp. HUAS 31]|nr:hypothetical protein [Streptomyces sp. HUAS 31]WCE00573.1 hypothetical protein PGH47_34820 [Streptomyces sp. HUAS 31]
MSEPTAPVAARDATNAHQAGPATLTATGHPPLATPATPAPAPKKALP